MLNLEIAPHIQLLWVTLIGLILLSAAFAFIETAYMSVNRYRLRHLIRKGNKPAQWANDLLERPDRLLGLILLCDTFADVLSSAIGTLLAVHYLGPVGIILSTLVITFIVLVFGELSPKTIAALYPMPIVLFSAGILKIILKILYPLIGFINFFSNSFLYIFGFRSSKKKLEHFTLDELRTLVSEGDHYIPSNYQKMLIQLLNLEKSQIEDIMVPKQAIIGIDLTKNWSEILDQLSTSQHTRLPVYQETIDNIQGILHVRAAMNLLAQHKLDKHSLMAILEKPYFIPEGMALNQQLLQFSQQKMRIGLVVDEYGDIQGLVAIEDILEEVVGEFTTDTVSLAQKDIIQEKSGDYILDGSINLRVLNRALHIQLSLDGPKTLSGLIIDYAEIIPPPHSCVCIQKYRFEILQVKDNMIKSVRLKMQDHTILTEYVIDV